MADDRPTCSAPAAFDPLLSPTAFDRIRGAAPWPAGSERVAAAFNAAVDRMSTRLAGIGVLTGMAENQCRELAALILDLDEINQLWTAKAPTLTRWRKLAIRGAGHVRRLDRKRALAEAALKDYAEHSRKLDEMFTDWVVPRVDQAVKKLNSTRLGPSGEPADQYAERMKSWPEQSTLGASPTENPRWQITGRLVAYLHDDAALAVIDAQVRTAKIGNALWSWDYAIVGNDFGAEDCPAVRMLLGRTKRLPKKSAPPRQGSPPRRTRKKNHP